MRRRLAALAVLTGSALPMLAVLPASAGGERRPTAAVSIGDSYIAGTAGRWRGNAATAGPGFLGTDRGYDPSDGTTDPGRVYGSTVGACLRSDTAEILSARLPVERRINLACGGARTGNLLRAASGGVPANTGEPPQGDALAAAAAANDVRLVAVSIGGNDLGFSAIVTSCVLAFVTSGPACGPAQQAAVTAALPGLEAAIGRSLADVRDTMADAGYGRRDYRLVVQTYPQPLAAAASVRYTGADAPLRASEGGCPIYDADLDWARGFLVPALNGAVTRAARAQGAQVLDLTEALRGHELCSATTETSDGRPGPVESEWVRFVDLAPQGATAESLHPNAYGQRALGHCLARAALFRSDVTCRGAARTVPALVRVRPLPAAAAAARAYSSVGPAPERSRTSPSPRFVTAPR